MGRHGSLLVALERAARAAARAKRQSEVDERRRIRDELRQQREELNVQQIRQRIDRQQFQLSRIEDAEAMTADLASRLDALRTVLEEREYPTQEDVFSSLEIRDPLPVLSIPKTIERDQPPPKREAYTAAVRPPAWWEKVLGYRRRYESQIKAAEELLSQDYGRWQREEAARANQLAALQQQHRRDLATYENKVAERKAEIQEFRSRYENADGDA